MVATPDISVIIPSYNCGRYLRDCVASVLACGGTELEVIVVDDGSTDGTDEIVKGLMEKDSRICYVYQENAGVSAARNHGIDIARGTMLFFVDGDDVVEPDMISALLPGSSKEQILGAMVLRTDTGAVSRANSFDHVPDYPTRNSYEPKDWGILYAAALLKSPCARAYSAEIIAANRIRFDENVAYGEDLLFNLEYIKHIDNIQLSDRALYHYIQHGTSNSSSRYLRGMTASVGVTAAAARSFCDTIGIGDKGYREFCASDILYLGLKAVANEFAAADKRGRYRRVRAILRDSDFRHAVRYGLRQSAVGTTLRMLLRLGCPPAIYAFYRLALTK